MKRRCASFVLVVLAAAATAQNAHAIKLQVGDIVLAHDDASLADPVVFPHWAHRLRFTCNVCHPAIFSMTESALITKDEMLDGESCGVCHNGRIGFAVTPSTCNRCHVQVEPRKR